MKQSYEQPSLLFAEPEPTDETSDNRYANGFNMVGEGQKAQAQAMVALYRRLLTERATEAEAETLRG